MSNKLALDANRRLATALGWTNIVDVGGALLGKPTWVCDNSRSQVQVPNWAGDWRDCGPLIAAHRIDIVNGAFTVDADWRYGSATLGCNEELRDTVTRLVVVEAVCDKLEAGK